MRKCRIETLSQFRPPVTLDELPSDTDARVLALSGDAFLRERLAELGFVPGTAVCVVRRAPLGDPLHVRVRGGGFAVRKDEAACITVAVEDEVEDEDEDEDEVEDEAGAGSGTP